MPTLWPTHISIMLSINKLAHGNTERSNKLPGFCIPYLTAHGSRTTITSQLLTFFPPPTGFYVTPKAAKQAHFLPYIRPRWSPENLPGRWMKTSKPEYPNRGRFEYIFQPTQTRHFCTQQLSNKSPLITEFLHQHSHNIPSRKANTLHHGTMHQNR